MSAGKLVVFAHPKTVIHLDYGDELDRSHGLCWSPDGKPESSYGFEAGDFDALLAKKRAIADAPGSPIELRVGPPVTRRFDMNPHGLI